MSGMKAKLRGLDNLIAEGLGTYQSNRSHAAYSTYWLWAYCRSSSQHRVREHHFAFVGALQDVIRCVHQKPAIDESRYSARRR
jgi:hypothetical protein